MGKSKDATVLNLLSIMCQEVSYVTEWIVNRNVTQYIKEMPFIYIHDKCVKV